MTGSETYELGTPTAIYRRDRKQVGLLGFTLLFGGLIAVTGGLLLRGGRYLGGVVFGGFGLLLFIGSAYAIITSLTDRGMRVLLFDTGLIEVKGGKQTVVHWADIRSVLESVIENRSTGAAMHTYKITLRDDHALILDSMLLDVASLGQAVQDQASSAMLPPAADAYRAGNQLDFGPLTLSLGGLTGPDFYAGPGRFGPVEIAHGRVIITYQDEEGETQQARLKLDEVPNAYLFARLVEQIGE